MDVGFDQCKEIATKKKKKMSLSFAAPSERNIIVIHHDELTNAEKEEYKEGIVKLRTEDALESKPLSTDGATAATRSLVESKTYKLQTQEQQCLLTFISCVAKFKY